MESYDSLKNLPRVPHTVGLGVQLGVGGNPPDKMYASSGEPVDISVACSRFQARRKGELPPIPGGLDDEDERLYVKPTSQIGKKMKVAQHGSLGPEDVARIKGEIPKDASPVPQEAGNASAQERDKDQAEEVFEEAVEPTVLQPLPPVPFPLESGTPEGVKVVYVDRPVIREKVKTVVKEVEKEPESLKWLKERTRIQVSLPDTSFQLPAIRVLEAPQAITLLLPASGDNMTFIPRAGARVSISYGGKTTRCMFTGASFDIPELGILGLPFIIPGDSSESAVD